MADDPRLSPQPEDAAGSPDSGTPGGCSDPSARQRDARSREYRLRHSRRRARTQFALIGLGVVTILAVGLLLTRLVVGGPGSEDAIASDSAPEPASAQTGESLDTGPADRETPTPVFAGFTSAYGSIEIHLPVPPVRLCEIGFHQAAGSRAYSVSSVLPDTDINTAANKTGTARTPDPSAPEEADVPLEGAVLRMWRSGRGGQPDTAMDVGAAAGTTVYAPVTGVITEVKPYLLYSKYDDFEIHIAPEGWTGVDVVMIHVDDVNVQAGDRVTGGVTPLAKVRLLSDRIDSQLADYSRDPGDHVHMQLNKPEAPDGESAGGGS